jgi:hypothetical protein
MDIATIVSIALFVLGGVFSVIGYLLRQKDVEQGEQIKMLFQRNDERQKQMQDLEVRMASHYYPKDELDRKFDKLEGTLAEGVRRIGAKIDEFGRALMKHIIDEDGRK